MNPGIFKSYDIRGTYPDQINEDAAYAIGRAFVDFLDAKTVVVGCDIRESSPSLIEALIRGLTDQGANVTDIGVVSTPMLYFASHELKTDGAIILTASHNPAQWNGMKMCREEAKAMGLGNGLEVIQEKALAGDFTDPETKGTVTKHDITPVYFKSVADTMDFADTKFKVVIDPANAMGIFELPLFKDCENIELSTIYDQPDGTFPNHEANPMKEETLTDLKAKVASVGADMGIAIDGDADRVGFIDENGSFVSGDIIIAIIARDILAHKPGSTILYDLRSTKAVREIVEELGGTAIQTRVGHSHIKQAMREHDAEFAGEVSMHFFFKDFGTCENSSGAVIRLLNMMAKTGKKLSELVAEVKRYHHIGEQNFEVTDTNAVIAKVKEAYNDGKITEIDGYKVEYNDWWFVVRASNTEPVLRLNLEADTAELMEEKRQELATLITG